MQELSDKLYKTKKGWKGVLTSSDLSPLIYSTLQSESTPISTRAYLSHLPELVEKFDPYFILIPGRALTYCRNKSSIDASPLKESLYAIGTDLLGKELLKHLEKCQD